LNFLILGAVAWYSHEVDDTARYAADRLKLLKRIKYSTLVGLIVAFVIMVTQGAVVSHINSQLQSLVTVTGGVTSVNATVTNS
jgi:hypothetical protein